MGVTFAFVLAALYLSYAFVPTLATGEPRVRGTRAPRSLTPRAHDGPQPVARSQNASSNNTAAAGVHVKSVPNDLQLERRSNYGTGAGLGDKFAKSVHSHTPLDPQTSNLGLTSAKSPATINLIYIRLPKAASSTTAGIFRRLGFHYGLNGYADDRWDFATEPGVWASHDIARKVINLADHAKLPYFLATMVRDPPERALSAFYYFECHVKHQVHEHLPDYKPTVDDILEYLRIVDNFMFRYITPEPWPESLRHELKSTSKFAVTAHEFEFKVEIENRIKTIMDAYDFIGISERYSESMVVLAHKLKVPLQDVLFFPSKLHDTEHTNSAFTQCAHVPLSEQHAAVRDYVVYSGEFRENNRLDYKLLHAVHTRLDHEIELLGATFPDDVATFERLQVEVLEACQQFDHPGDPDMCLWQDTACGYRCLEDFGRTHKFKEP